MLRVLQKRIASEASSVCKMIYDFLRQKYKVDHQILRNFFAQLISRVLFISKITIHFSHFENSKMSRKMTHYFDHIIFDKNIQEECTNRYSTTRVLLLVNDYFSSSK